MKRHGVSIIGSFGFGKTLRDGQTIKTHQLADYLAGELGEETISRVDTHGWKRAPFRLLRNVVMAARRSDRVIMLPAQSAVKLIPRLCVALAAKGTKIYYDVIGGWLPEYLEDKPRLAKTLKKTDGIWVETEMMKRKLEEQGFGNVTVIPNFKNIRPLEEGELPEARREGPYTFMTFSRVSRDKGIEDAIEAITLHNSRSDDSRKARLKIYGRIAPGYEEQFNRVVAEAGDSVEYCGEADATKSVEILKDGFMLLFPSYYAGEGFPGTILDGYCSGLPVIASDWRYNRELVREGETGFIVAPRDPKGLAAAIDEAVRNPQKIASMRKACLAEAGKYTAEKTGAKILGELRSGDAAV